VDGCWTLGGQWMAAEPLEGSGWLLAAGGQ